MARMKYDDAAFTNMLNKLENSDSVAKAALYDGANVLADGIRDRLESLPTDKWWFCKNGEKIKLTDRDKKDLLDGLGIAGFKADGGSFDTSIGFDGYAEHKDYQIPLPMLARSVESGNSFRQKQPFIRPSVAQKRKEVVQAMQTSISKNLGGQ